MSFKNRYILAALAALLLAFTVEAQQSNVVQDLTAAFTDLTKIVGAVSQILTNPAGLVNGGLGDNVGEIVNRFADIVQQMAQIVPDLLQAFGLASK